MLKVQKIKANFKFSSIKVCIYLKTDEARNGFCLKVLSIVWNLNENLELKLGLSTIKVSSKVQGKKCESFYCQERLPWEKCWWSSHINNSRQSRKDQGNCNFYCFCFYSPPLHLPLISAKKKKEGERCSVFNWITWFLGQVNDSLLNWNTHATVIYLCSTAIAHITMISAFLHGIRGTYFNYWCEMRKFSVPPLISGMHSR